MTREKVRRKYEPIVDDATWERCRFVIGGSVRLLPGYEGRYSASSDGYIFGTTGTRLRAYREMHGEKTRGVVYVTLWDGVKRRREQLARLIWMAFQGPLESTKGLLPKDNDLRNCRLDNLELLTPTNSPFTAEY